MGRGGFLSRCLFEAVGRFPRGQVESSGTRSFRSGGFWFLRSEIEIWGNRKSSSCTKRIPPRAQKRKDLYRKRKVGKIPPSRDEALKLMAAEPNLIRRPVVLRGLEMVLGYDEEALARIAKQRSA